MAARPVEAMTAGVHWVKTVGAAEPGDPRDGELHQLFGEPPDHFDVQLGDESAGDFVRYIRSDSASIVDDGGRTVWIYEFRPDADG
jgi:hypothetical protein